MDFAKLKQDMDEASRRGDEDREEKSARFRHRVKGQRFLRDFAPLVTVLVDRPDAYADFPGMVEDCENLAKAIARAIHGDGDLKPALVLPYRRQATEIMARAYASGAVVDREALARTLASGMSQAVPGEDVVNELSAEGSLQASMLPIRARIVDMVSVYDFRVGVADASKVLIDAVMRRALQVSEGQNDGQFSETDRRTLVQTCARAFGSTLCAVYRRLSADYVRRLLPLDESEKLRILDVERPIERIVSEFNLLASLYEEMAFGVKNLEPSIVPSMDGDRLDDGMRERPVPTVR